MGVILGCPECGRSFNVGIGFAGKKIHEDIDEDNPKCPKCKVELTEFIGMWD